MKEGLLQEILTSKYGRLTPIGDTGKRKSNKAIWKFLCDCGKITEILLESVRAGKTKSCGCLRLEILLDRITSHGMKGTQVYTAFMNISSRCTNPNHPFYEYYGGRGISFQWKGDFLGFYKEIGDPPDSSLGWTVERLDTNIGYVESNLKWAKMDEQCRNKRMYKNNTSGVVGVRMQVRNSGSVAWIAVIGGNGNKLSKTFAVKIYGEEAFRLACEWREKMLRDLAEKGIVYKNPPRKDCTDLKETG